MQFELTKDDALFLRNQLVAHVREVQSELAHTEQHELQRSLAKDLTRLQQITENLNQQLRTGASG
jgi:hypothetical protein